MSDFRCYCDATVLRTDRIELSNEESHHLINTNRAREGDEVIAFNGDGVEWQCEIQVADGKQAVLTPKTYKVHEKPDRYITLILAAPKGKGLESIVRRATELGVWQILPIITSRTELKIITDRQANKMAKLKAAAIEGAKQSGNPFLPKIGALQPLLYTLGDFFDLNIVASLQPETRMVKDVFSEFRGKHQFQPKNVACLIGPEGDFSEEEYKAIAKHDFKPVTIGPFVQRCETAAVSILSIVRQEISNG